MFTLRTTSAALVAAGLVAAAPAQSRLQILHASDLEGGVNAIGDAPNFTAVVEGLEADASANGTASILLSAGDNYIPGPFFSAAGDFSMRATFRSVLGNPDAREAVGRADVAIMNLMGVDASAVGNHEFDAGTSVMEDIIGPDIRDSNGDQILDQPRWLGSDFPYLSANLDFSGDSNIGGFFTSQILSSTEFAGSLGDLAAAAGKPKIAPATIIERGTERYGVVGATTQLVASITSPGGVTVIGGDGNDMAILAGVLQPTIDALTSAGIDKIILVSHLQQIALEEQLIGLLEDVDVVIAGGSGTILADADDRLRNGDVASGTYPIETTDLNGNPALIVSTRGQYSYVGRLVLDFDSAGNVIPSSVSTSESGVFATDDQGVIDLFGDLTTPFLAGTDANLVQELTGALRTVVLAKDSNIFGRTDVYLEGRRGAVRTQETNLGNLTADANLAIAQSFDPTVAVSLKNGGGIRASIGSIDSITGALLPPQGNPEAGKLVGEVSQLDIENTLRFNNGLVLITLTRAQLKQVLEHAVAGVAPGSTPGSFAQVGGVSFSYDPTRPVGDRVRTAGILERDTGFPFFVFDGTVIGSEPIRIVTLDFLAGGGDGYPYPDFVAANPGFANRVDLETAGLADGVATFTDAGSEQDALAEYLFAEHASMPFDAADGSIFQDLRIQDRSLRRDLVIAYVLRSVFF